jgi:hypothetical protein
MFEDKGSQIKVQDHETGKMKVRLWSKDYLSYDLKVKKRKRQMPFTSANEMRIQYTMEPEKFTIVCEHVLMAECLQELQTITDTDPHATLEMVGWNETHVTFRIQAPHVMLQRLQSKKWQITCDLPETQATVVCRHSKFEDSLKKTCAALEVQDSNVYLETRKCQKTYADYINYCYGIV